MLLSKDSNLGLWCKEEDSRKCNIRRFLSSSNDSDTYYSAGIHSDNKYRRMSSFKLSVLALFSDEHPLPAGRQSLFSCISPFRNFPTRLNCRFYKANTNSYFIFEKRTCASGG
ncbi:hypothetical protein CEXT_778831 [Caerostris extrusa]|uniref:Uncharacterized protein n=1 Tax=Caerostris extrusa TaxID=172846 RepID=A0AAV4Y957_CAEEX|nr:hypothetical protein CEXT_778831 [Caerostris extrusa]